MAYHLSKSFRANLQNVFAPFQTRKEEESTGSESESNPSFGQSIYDRYPPDQASDHEEAAIEAVTTARPDPMGKSCFLKAPKWDLRPKISLPLTRFLLEHTDRTI